MKRLLRKAEFDYNRFLNSLVGDNHYSQSEIDTVISNNPDCLFDGFAFRILYFDNSEVVSARDKYLKNEDTKDMVEILWGTLENLIDINGLYQSFAKNENGIQSVDDHLNEGSDFGIIIKMNVIGSLDIEKLFNKYKDQLDEETIGVVEYFKNQEEVMAKLDTDDYYYMGGLDMNVLKNLK